MRKGSIAKFQLLFVLCLVSSIFAGVIHAQDRKNPLKPRIVIEFTGNISFPDNILLTCCKNELSRLKSKARFSSDFNYVIIKRHIADDAAYKLLKLYQQSGFSFVQISYDFVDINNGLKVVFKIVENNKLFVSEVNIIGNTEFSKEYIHRILLNVKGALLDSMKTIFIEKHLHQGLQQLMDLYIEAGYYDFAVRSLEIKYDTEPPFSQKVVITLILNEGLKYNITRFSLRGKLANLEDVVLKSLRIFRGSQLNSKTRLLIINNAQEIYKKRGYWNCKIELTSSNNPEDGHVEIDVNIDAGKKYRLNNFFFNKTKSVKHSFLKSLLTMKKDDVYDIDNERESIRRLLRTNLLSDVEIKYFPAGDNLLDCNITVKESWLSELKVVIGYGSYEKFRGYLELANNNIFGIGRRVAAKFGNSQMSQFVEGEFRDMWTLDLPNTSFIFTPFYRKRIEPGFTLQEFGFSMRIEYLLTNEITLAAEYELKESRAFDITDPGVLFPSDINAFLGTIRGYFLFDDRDSILNPTEGMRSIVRFEVFDKAFGGSTDFIKFSAISSYYSSIGLKKKIVFAFKFITSFWVNLSGIVPIQERLYNGGEASVRCFFEHEMKPGDNPIAQGGQVKNVASYEMRVPLIWEWGLDTTFFIDIGNLAAKFENYFSNWEIGVGVGIRYLTPFGVLRLDFAINTDYFNDPSKWAFHLSLGYPF
ncbi:MAG: BamA/TamA family outer membrane protein [Planctomycetes bacterium]|nr:BamA/TamA family outer membrane protein [Planctomycetota bacterium]